MRLVDELKSLQVWLSSIQYSQEMETVKAGINTVGKAIACLGPYDHNETIEVSKYPSFIPSRRAFFIGMNGSGVAAVTEEHQALDFFKYHRPIPETVMVKLPVDWINYAKRDDGWGVFEPLRKIIAEGVEE